jgi:predicted DNA-binding protein (MmcQ/YjbR family)
MQETFVDRHCAALPGTTRELPFGDDTVIWTVNGRMFAAYMMGGEGLSLRIGDQVSAQQLLKRRRSIGNPFLSAGGWVLVPWGAGPDVLRMQINESYRLVLGDRNAVAKD